MSLWMELIITDELFYGFIKDEKKMKLKVYDMRIGKRRL